MKLDLFLANAIATATAFFMTVNPASALVFGLNFTGNGNAYSGTGVISFDNDFTGAMPITSLSNYQSSFTIGTRTYTQGNLADNPFTSLIVVSGTPGNRTLQFRDNSGPAFTALQWTTDGFSTNDLTILEDSNTILGFRDTSQGIDPAIPGTFTAVEVPFEFESAFGLLAAGAILGSGFYLKKRKLAKLTT